MRPKIFEADTVAAAMERVRRALGEEAIILSVDADPDGGVRVMAATEDAGPEMMPFGGIDDPDDVGTHGMGGEIRQGLAYHGVPKPLAERLARTATALKCEGSLRALAGACEAMFSFAPLLRSAPDRPLLLAGPPGCGKTLAAAKIATRLRRTGRAPTVIATDGRRAGGLARIEALVKVLGIQPVAVETPEALRHAAAAQPAPVLIDTGGTNPFDEHQMNELEALIEASGAEPILVMPAGGDPMESIDIASAFASFGVGRVVATRLDMAQRIGGLLAAACASRLAFAEVCTSPHATGGLTAISATSLARLVLPHAPEAARAAEQARTGSEGAAP